MTQANDGKGGWTWAWTWMRWSLCFLHMREEGGRWGENEGRTKNERVK